MNNERNPHIVSIPVGTQAAGITLPGCNVRKHSRIKEVRYIDQAGLASGPTNYVTVSLKDSGGATYASLTTNSAGTAPVSLVANRSALMALSSPVGDVANQPEADVPAGTDLQIVVAQAGTGALTKGVLQIEMYPL